MSGADVQVAFAAVQGHGTPSHAAIALNGDVSGTGDPGASFAVAGAVAAVAGPQEGGAGFAHGNGAHMDVAGRLDVNGAARARVADVDALQGHVLTGFQVQCAAGTSDAEGRFAVHFGPAEMTLPFGGVAAGGAAGDETAIGFDIH